VSTVERRWGAGPNAEATAAWDGPLFDAFLKYRHLIVAGLANHGDRALRLFPPMPGQRVLDIGCGFGDTTQQIAAMVGPAGEAVGVDVAPSFIKAAQAENESENASFKVADVQTEPLGGPYDMVFSRMGTMFFMNPVAALRNVRHSLVEGGRLVMVVWRRRLDNAWMYRAQEVVEKIVPRPEEYDDPTCGPGPFSMANADTTSDILVHAGYSDIEFHRCDLPILSGTDIDEAVELVMTIGPAGEILRLQGERAAHLHGQVRAALKEGMSEFAQDGGELWAPASTWIVSASAPGAQQ
jgi:SAM-dependent methyltransferase